MTTSSSPTIEELAKAMLDINTYAAHDGECEANTLTGNGCTCGYNAASKRVLDLAEQVASTPQPEGWRDISSAPKGGDRPVYINVRSISTYRWLPYKPDGRRQMGKVGRWQVAAGEYGGWDNADLPQGGEWIPHPQFPQPPSEPNQ
jgi:hypothetical protein